MSTPKGWPSQEKEERVIQEYATVEPVRKLQHGMSVLAHQFVYVVGTDAAEANSTTYVVNATAHSAQVGDVIRFTSGTFSGREAKVYAVSANTITLAEALSSAVGTGDTFQILRHKYPLVGADGTIPVSATLAAAPVQFVLDGVDTEVLEDTVTPANNRPLPVKLVGTTGTLTVTAQQLDVQSTHTGANPDSMRIGDGTETANVTASNQLEVAVTAALPAGTNNIGDVDVLTEPATVADGNVGLPAVVKVVAGWDGLAVQALATDSSGVLSVNVLTERATAADGTSLPAAVKVVAGYDGANVQALSTDSNGELQVDILSSALPSGAATLAEQQAQTASLSVLDDWDESDRAKVNPIVGQAGVQGGSGTVSANTQRVVLATDVALPAGTNAIGTVALTRLDVVDFIDGANSVLDTSSTNIPGSGGSPVTLVASLAANVKAIQIMDTTGGFVGIYTGAAAAEVLQAIYGPGSDSTIEVAMSSGERVSAKRLDSTTALSSGVLAINFLA